VGYSPELKSRLGPQLLFFTILIFILLRDNWRKGPDIDYHFQVRLLNAPKPVLIKLERRERSHISNSASFKLNFSYLTLTGDVIVFFITYSNTII